MKVSIVDYIVLEFNNIEERDSAEAILAKMNAPYCISPVIKISLLSMWKKLTCACSQL